MKKILFFLFSLFVLLSCGEEQPTEPVNSIDDSPVTEYGNIRGTVKNISTNLLISGVVVSCDGKSYTTFSDGQFELKNIETGIQNLTASKSDFETYSTTITISSGTKTKNIQMTASIASTSISGIIKDDYSNNPIPVIPIKVNKKLTIKVF